ncbi:MerR family transcriptional regulator [Pedobacter sp. SYP-B3415]|uniref:MerR family transcriptional regulator n=1 Tax=Pedobacter sp. SYP-B3415 TaxID=2496641 RepID=UPI00101C2C1E|nr:MerR family transcriptional regulator [Pedobacter sp. SYP-B3415]
MRKFSISDIENLTGIKAHTIRIWELRYNLVPAKRTATNIRYYNEDDLKQLLNIATLNESGYKISKIAKLGQEKINSLVAQLQANRTNDAVQVQMLSNAVLQYDEAAFNKILDGCVSEHGLTNTMDQVLFPFMKKIGMLWQTKTINPSHEHFASNLIRERIIVEIEKLGSRQDENPRRFLLFLPEEESHETGLIFARYLLKSCGHETLYLGPNVDYDDLKAVVAHYKPDFVLSVLTSLRLDKDLNKMLEKLMHYLDVPLIVAGSLISEFDIVTNDRLIPLKNVCELVDFASQLANPARS